MGYKYKLKEEFAIGDIKVDGGVKSKVTNVDSNTGAITWNIEYVPNLSKLVEDSMELATTAKGVYQKAKDDKVFLDIYKQAKELRNLIRTHVRNNYPEDYKTAISEEDVDEMSTSGAAGSYLTPYAFRKKGAKADDEAYTELGYTVVKEDKSQYPSFEVDKNIKYQDTVITKGYWSYTGKESAGRGVYLNVMNQQMQAFNREDIEIFQKNLPSHFNIIKESLDEAEFKGKEVALGKPKRGGSKAYYVYVKDGDKVKKVTFGSGGLRAKIKNKEARNAFAARHKCKDKKDRTTAGYWSCNLPRYASQLGLGANQNTFW